MYVIKFRLAEHNRSVAVAAKPAVNYKSASSAGAGYSASRMESDRREHDDRDRRDYGDMDRLITNITLSN